MALPDLTDIDKMLHIGRMTVLRKARREVAQRLRDRIVPLLNHFEGGGEGWDVTDIAGLVDEINAINHAIAELN